MKLQAEKTSLSLVPDVLPPASRSSESNKKTLVSSLVKIKPKKRTAAPLQSKTAKRKQGAEDKEKEDLKRESDAAKKESPTKDATPANTVRKPSAQAPTSLLLGYSSSSSDSEAEG